MRTTKLLTLLALLLTAATGAWAQSTTHIVKQDNVNTIFGGAGYTLGSGVTAGDILDFQGEIDLQHSLIVNKQVTIKSTTKDAVVKLNTPTNVASNAYTATVMYPQSFVINKDGSGTTVQDIRIENTETWIYNTSNVTFTGVTFHVDARVGSGVGHLAVRYSDNVKFDGCTIYTKDNGSTSSFVLTGSSNCTVENCTILSEGSVGNPLVLGNTQNANNDKPNGFSLVNDHNTVKNCTINAPISSMCRVNLCGKYGLLEGNTITCDVGSGFGAVAPTSFDERITYRNNTIGGNLGPLAYSTVEGNTVAGTLSVPQGSVLTDNNVTGNVTISANSSDYTGSTITGNSILGKVTFSNNSKNNTFTDNTVISSEAYAVVMASTKDANNTVTDNVLLAASNAGDAAVNLNNGTGNTISDNLSEAATGDVTWNFDAATGTLTIGGTGAMADYDQTTAPWAFLSDKIIRVVIGDGVTKVGSNAFQGCTALNDVFVKGANTLTIGTAAFDATKTPAIYVPTGTEAAYQTAWSAYAGSIGEYMNCGADVMAVYDAASHTLTICGKGAMTDFASAADQPWKSLQGQLQTVCFEPFITAIGANAFSGCSALTAANIEGTGVTIADGAFDGNATGRRIFVPVSAIAGYGESSHAADIYATGQCGAEGSDISWELNAKTMALSISGTGAMADYASYSSVPWYSVRGKITSVTIAEGVTSVGSYAFYSCSNLANVNIPATVTSVGDQAFRGCSALTDITLPAGLTSIGSFAFSGCNGLTTVTIPDGVTEISNYAFADCAALTTISIPAGVTSIGISAFANCAALTSIDIPAGVTTINSNLFNGCTSLTAITIPDGVTSINSSAFHSCSKLESITLPASVTSVYNYAFLECSMLAEVNIFAVSLQTYGYNAFMNTHADLKIYVPAASVDTYKAGWSAYADKFAALPYYALTMKEGTQDADKWTVKAGTDGSFQSLPLEGVKAGTKVKLKYDGDRSMLKGVKAKIEYPEPAANSVDLSKLTADYEAQDGEVLTGTLGANVKISIAAGATVTLDGVTINGVKSKDFKWAGITCVGDATIILKDGTTNTVMGFKADYPGIFIASDKTLTIKGETAGTGSLNARSNGSGAGIGGGYQIACGNIEIQGGVITATGGSNSAGIGSGRESSCGNITISGGSVTATGGANGAGIGSGYAGSCGNITITTGVTQVTATKGDYAPNSIGKAEGSSSCGTVTIGGSVTGNITTSPYTYQPSN